MAIGTPVDLGHNQTSSATTLAITTIAAVPAGSAIIVYTCLSVAGAFLASVTDTAGDVFIVDAYSGAPEMVVAFAANSAGMASGATITVNLSTAANKYAITAIACSGLGKSNGAIRDTRTRVPSTTGTATSATQTSNTLTMPQMLCTVAMSFQSTNPGTFTPGAGFTSIGGTTSVQWINAQYQVCSAITPVTCAPSWTTSSTYRLYMDFWKADVPGGGGGLTTHGVG